MALGFKTNGTALDTLYATYQDINLVGNSLWGWGSNVYYELGLLDNTNRSSPNQITSAEVSWTQVTLTSRGTIARKSDGTLWAWGSNQNYPGELGRAGSSTPAQIAGSNWNVVNSASSATLALKSDGTLWGWGSNVYGQLGLGSYPSTPVQIGSDTNWSKISRGTSESYAIKTNGTLWATGMNYYGQLGLGNTSYPSAWTQVGSDTNWADVAGGNQYVIARKTNGTIWSWGRNINGSLGLGNGSYYSSPVQIGSLSNWSKIFTGGAGSCYAIKTDGTLWSWGRGFSGLLGLGDSTSRNSPVQVGALTNWHSVNVNQESRVVALKTDGTLWAWGYNSNGRLGLNNTSYPNPSPIQIGSLTNWAFIPNGGTGDHTVAGYLNPYTAP